MKTVPKENKTFSEEKTETKQQVIELMGQEVWDKLVELSKATGNPSEVVEVSFMNCNNFSFNLICVINNRRPMQSL